MHMLSAFKVTTVAILQIFILGLIGYVFTKKKVVSVENLKFLSKLVINLLFPCFIFAKLISNFDFRSYPNWWLFPLMSFFVTATGFLVAKLFIKLDSNLGKFNREFTSLVTFQNGGYLPLILVALLLPPGRREEMFIYIFLFLLGFNSVMWSIGVFYLTQDKSIKFKLHSLFSPPAIAVAVSLFAVAVRLHKIIPYFLIGTVRMIGDCALPLAIMVVGANLALIDISSKANVKHIVQVVLAKLLFLPLLFLGLILLIKPPYMIALLLLLQGAAPSAVSSSMILRYHEKKDNIVSLGIFWTHLVSLLTIPIFLILFSMFKDFIYR